MRYWHAPLREKPDDLFCTPDTYRNNDVLYVGEISRATYEQETARRADNEIDEFGLPL